MNPNYTGPTPDPRGVTAPRVWSLLALAKRTAQPHWSYDDRAAARSRRAAKAARRAALLASI